MAGKKYNNSMDSDSVADGYINVARVVATAMETLNECVNRCEALTETTCDNGDPEIELREAVAKLGNSLAIIINYSGYYRDEAQGKNKENEH